MRIPTLLAVTLFLTLTLTLLMFNLYRNESDTRFKQNISPQNIRYVNLTSNSFTITWQTAEATEGQLTWGETTSLGNLNLDARDQNQAIKRFTHFVTVSNLKPDSTYFFKLRSGPFFFPEQPFSIRTASSSDRTTLNPIIGKVLLPDLQPSTDTLIFLELNNTPPLAAFTTPEGNFVLPLVNLKNNNLEPYQITQNQEALLTLTNSKNQSTAKILLPSKTPLPPITLGTNIDLTKN